MVSPSSRLATLIRGHSTVAVADGAGAPLAFLAPLAEAAAPLEGVRVALGWCLEEPPLWVTEAFDDVVTFMPGHGLRAAVRSGLVRYLPIRLGSWPALLRGQWRPDVLLATLRPTAGGYCFGTELAWMAAAVESGATVAGVVAEQLPVGRDPFFVPAHRVQVVGEADGRPVVLPPAQPTGDEQAVGAAVAALVVENARVQVGPGGVGAATLRAIDAPVEVWSGVITDEVAGLDQRGLLTGVATGAYVTGGNALYEWIERRGHVRRVEETHDVTALAHPDAPPFFAVNSALQVDLHGHVNVERIHDRLVGGVGGHADFALAGSKSASGLSVIALPTARRGESTLVDRLDSVSTPRVDVDVIVTERGSLDLRCVPEAQRAAAPIHLWGGVEPGLASADG